MTHATPDKSRSAEIPPLPLHPGKTILTVVASAVGMLIIFAILPILLKLARPGVDTSAYDQGVEKLSALRAEQERQLVEYGWSDQSAGVVRVPLEQAREALVREGIGPASRPAN